MWSVLAVAALLQGCSAQVYEPSKDSRDSPQQAAKNYFGDVKLNHIQVEALKSGGDMGGGNNGYAAVNGENLRWKNGIIPYEFDCSIENLDDAVSAAKAAMAEWEAKTCIRFVKHTNEKFRLRFIRDTHCWGNVGQVSYSRISIGHGCEYQHVMTHEIGHVVGFYHEQNRMDRDDWVNVFWKNIGRFNDAFDKVKNTDSYGVPYDYESIMHYPWSAFSSNGKDTMSPKKPTNGKLPYIELSKDDALQTSKMYNCPKIVADRKRVAKLQHKDDLKLSADPYKSCVDNNKNCPSWAKTGLCSNSQYVMQNCPLSCNAPGCQLNCIDENPYCADWASAGHCQLVAVVRKHCQKSCNSLCKGGNPTTVPPTPPPNTDALKTDRPTDAPTDAPTPPATAPPNTDLPATQVPTQGPTKVPATKLPAKCIDEKTACPAWAKAGFCGNNEQVKILCVKSCDPECNGGKNPPTQVPHTHLPVTTGDAPVTNQPATNPPVTGPVPTSKPTVRNFLGKGVLCLDYNEKCDQWAKEGECESNPGWMRSNCMKACKVTSCDAGVLKPPGACATPLGLAWNGTSTFQLPDSAFHSPANLSPGAGWEAAAMNARLYYPDDYDNLRIGAWCAASHESAKSMDGYVQVDLQEVRTINYIATQGRDKYFERISKFKIKYSSDGVDYKPFQMGGKDKVFDANCDHVTPVLNKFPGSITARYIRVEPWEWNYPCLRMELYGC